MRLTREQALSPAVMSDPAARAVGSSMRPRRYAVIAALLLMLALAATLLALQWRAGRASAASGTAATAGGGEWVTLKREDFEEVCSEEGELRPAKVTTITFTRWAKLAWLLPEGARVKKGDKVATQETEELTKKIQQTQDDIADAERSVAQQEQALDLDRKRLETELLAEKDRRDLARLKETELLARPTSLEKDQAENMATGAVAHTAAARSDYELIAPLAEKGYVSRVDVETKALDLQRAKVDEEAARIKAARVLAGGTELERAKAAQARLMGEIAYQVKELERDRTLNDDAAKVAGAKRWLQELNGRLVERKRWLEESVRTAPHDGIIVYRQSGGGHDNKKIEVGDYVGPWRCPVDLPNYDVMKVRTQVPESVVAQLTARRVGASPAAGSPARVRVQNRIYPAEVIWIDGWARDRNADLSEADAKSQGFSGLQVFNVEVELRESDPERLREGFRAQVEIPLNTLHEVLVIPRHAVAVRSAQAMVQADSGDGPAARTVTLGPESGGRVVVLDGLSEGDRILVPPAPPKPLVEQTPRRGEPGAEEAAAGSGAGKAEKSGTRGQRGGGRGGK